MIKLVQNELIKIWKRKSIYFLFLVSIIAITVHNNLNPDQNEFPDFINSTKFEESNISKMEKELETMDRNTDEYIIQKITLDFEKLYTSFKEDSWQRFALKEEQLDCIFSENNIGMPDYRSDIYVYLKTINDYELKFNKDITYEDYNFAKEKYKKYVEALNSNDWKEFVKLKIQNLEERKKIETLTEKEIDGINIELEIYEIRLRNNINFNYNIQNNYLEEYRIIYYYLLNINDDFHGTSEAWINNNINNYEGRKALCKYAIENNWEQDISNETNNIIIDNKIDARISFIRTFRHFDLIIVVISIYLSTTTVTEEINKRTIKTLLTKPHKRSSIIISKIIACVATIIISMIFVVIAQFVIGGIIFGFDSYNLGYIGYDCNNHQVIVISLFKYIILVGLTKLPMYIMIIAFCIFIGIINNHTSMSMILTLIIFIISSTAIREWSKVESLSIITRFFITNNWDFSIYLFGQVSDISGITLYSSILIYIIYFAVLLYLSIHSLNRKDIVNV